MEASYGVDAEKHICVIDATTRVGLDICRIFTGYATREYGHKAFIIQRAQITTCATT